MSSDGVYTTTTCTWSTPEAVQVDSGENDDDDDDNDNPDDPDNPDDGDTSDTSEAEAKDRDGMTVTIDTNIVEYAIFNHPKYKDTKWGAKDMLMLSMWLSGNIDVSDLSQHGGSLDADGVEMVPDHPTEIQEVMKGPKHFKCPIKTYTLKYTLKRLPRKPFASLAKISTASGVNFTKSVKIDGKNYPVNYLKSSVSITKMGRYSYSVTESYRQSPPGGWDADLYKK